MTNEERLQAENAKLRELLTQIWDNELERRYLMDSASIVAGPAKNWPRLQERLRKMEGKRNLTSVIESN